jgi:hypothetical protein
MANHIMGIVWWHSAEGISTGRALTSLIMPFMVERYLDAAALNGLR